jgi:hypothetical protein
VQAGVDLEEVLRWLSGRKLDPSPIGNEPVYVFEVDGDITSIFIEEGDLEDRGRDTMRF